MPAWTDLRDRKCSYAAGSEFMQTVGRNSILNFPAKFEQECAVDNLIPKESLGTIGLRRQDGITDYISEFQDDVQ